VYTIGLKAPQAAKLVIKLNDLLCDFSMLYINTRGYHWNVRGEKFFELHLKFEEIYNDLQLKMDEVAERILTLGGIPEHSYAKYLKNSEIKPDENQTDGKVALSKIVQAYQTLLVKERKILALSAEANDEGTNALMSDYIRLQEKQVWMFSAYLS
jgi:starvation-inducible DNA-binding protein